MTSAALHQILLVELHAGEILDSKVVHLHKGKVQEFDLNLSSGWIVRFKAGRKLLGRAFTLKVDKLGKEFKFPDLKSLLDFDVFYDIQCDKFGTFKYEFVVDGSPEEGGHGYFTVLPEWNVQGKILSLNALSVQTYLTKLLGPLSEWTDRVQVAKEAGYNVVHLTPVQTLGVSNSSYSVADFHGLNPSLGPVTFEDLAKWVEFLEKEWSILTIQDVVWNHAARNAPWLQEHPECAYNCENSPHLRPAFVVDQALKLFSDEIADGKWESKGIPAKFNNDHHIAAMIHALYNDIIPQLKLYEFTQVNVEKVLNEFVEYCKSHGESDEKSDEKVVIIQDNEFKRLGSTIDFELARKVFYNKQYVKHNGPGGQESITLAAENLKNHLNQLNAEKQAQSDDDVHSIVNATVGHTQYERVAAHGPRLPKVTRHHPLTTNYFVFPFEVKSVEDANNAIFDPSRAKYIMACNGWVMNTDPLKNFAEPHSRVYWRRELVSWGDSIKLNYGYKPEDCPYLWQYMLDYTLKCVSIFHGVRIDNCHSTPIHVAEYLLDKAREQRPGLYVMAELFTGSEHLDNLFVNRLGITSLIREAQNAPDSHEQGRFVHRFGGDPVGAFRHKGNRPAPSSVAHALFYDQTHDNPAAAVKRTIYDYVPTASMIAMTYCAAASNRGYDEFIPFHIHVVTEERLYRKWSEMVQNPTLKGMVEARRKFNDLHVSMVEQGYSEVFVDQYNADTVAITRHNPITRESVLLIAHTCFGTFKWKPDYADHKCIPVEDHIAEILFEIKTVEDVNQPTEAIDASTTLSGVQNLAVEVYEHVPIDKSLAVEVHNGQIKFKTFPSGAVVAFKINPRESTVKSCSEVEKLTQCKDLKNELDSALQSLSIDQLNYLLYYCEAEEQSQFNSGGYNVSNFGTLVYCGLKGVETVIRKIQATNDLGHPLCGNLRGGTWLPNYIVNRLKRLPELAPVVSVFEKAFRPLETLPNFLRPCYFEGIFTVLYNGVESVVLQKLGTKSLLPLDPVINQRLALVAISFVASIQNALLPPLHPAEVRDPHPPSLAAGLPHFATGIWRNWGRDTFISLPGLLLTLGRFTEARQLILAYGGTLRHGLIPNLLAEGKAARYNCRDAVWFWLSAIVRYVEKSDEGANIFNANVLRIYPNDDGEYATDKVEPLHATITEALNRHFEGISFRERNAGGQIDEHMRSEGFDVDARICRETGLVFGGNAFNCGTWMDKMGSSDRAHNRGFPSSPRDGAAVELQGLALFVAEHLHHLHQKGQFPSPGLQNAKDGTKWAWSEWAQKIRTHFGHKFYVELDSNEEFVNRRGIIKDTFGSSARYTDFQLRPNFCIALKYVPDIVDPEKAWHALEVASQNLRAPLGICTLDPSDWNYDGNYDNDNDGYDKKLAKGWNYHQGPEWLWVAAEYYSARLKVATLLKARQPETWEKALGEVKEQVQRYASFMALESAWSSLPELTNRDGSHCPHSCESQAWSIGCFIETLDILNQQLGN